MLGFVLAQIRDNKKPRRLWEIVLHHEKKKTKAREPFVKSQSGEEKTTGALKEENTVPAVKHGGGALVRWCCFAAGETLNVRGAR